MRLAFVRSEAERNKETEARIRWVREYLTEKYSTKIFKNLELNKKMLQDL